MSCVMEGLKTEDHLDIKDQVTMYIDGKHGRIGIIVPQRKPTIEEVTQYHRTIAEIIINNTKSHA
ncbi:hypothetical protein M5X06_27200 [Paenibacillus alvei]|uniref:Uncharacterized protein n=1 Tax=Paenibacillus alvei TaxID=44250 RepID=A0ABT4H7R9_PAEAL|nr:hypothetical protein [Paenibacillus alvei]MCY9765031.1 hypothetical protein [Paenibacillus alvei]MCY9770473.1 hypothetical protein [Paenibacillus alvei]